jgi:hypothetical protein
MKNSVQEPVHARGSNFEVSINLHKMRFNVGQEADQLIKIL